MLSLLENLRDTVEARGGRILGPCYRAGLLLDCVIRGPGGGWIGVVEKLWEPFQESAEGRGKAAQARRYAEQAGLDDVFLVVPGIGTAFESLGVFEPKEFKEQITGRLEAERHHPSLSSPTPPVELLGSDIARIFCAMPFAPRYDDTYFLGIAHAAEAVGAVCIREDCARFSEPILERIHRDIRESTLIVADLSGGNPNVLYEVGFGHALKKPTIHIASTPVEELPFNVKGWRTIPYELGQVHRLRSILVEQMRTMMGENG